MIPSQNLSIAISRFSMFSIQIFLDAERKRERTFSKRFLFPSKMLIKKRNEPRVTFVWSVVLVTLGRSLSANTSVLFNFPIRIPGFPESGRVSFVADKFNSRPRIWSSPGLHPDFHPDTRSYIRFMINYRPLDFNHHPRINLSFVISRIFPLSSFFFWKLSFPFIRFSPPFLNDNDYLLRLTVFPRELIFYVSMDCYPQSDEVR